MLARLLIPLLAVPMLLADEPAPAGFTVVVTASYPGANATTVAEVIAAPIEQQVNGVEGQVRIESESANDGSYVARVRFGPKVDRKVAAILVEVRVAIALPVLPEEARRRGVAVKVAPAEPATKMATIALQDRGANGHAALRKWAETVAKRLADSGAVKPVVFPGPDVPQLVTKVDRARCAQLDVSPAAVLETVEAAGPTATPDELRRLLVRAGDGKVALGAVASFEAMTGPAVVHRVDLFPAVRLSAAPPAGQTPAEAAAKWAGVAATDRPKGFEVVPMSGK